MNTDLRNRLRSISRIVSILMAVLLGLFGIWCAGAVHYCIAIPFALPIFLSLLAAGIWGGFHRRWMFLPTALLEMAVMACFALRTPETAFARTVWQQPWKERPQVEFLSGGDRVKIRNVRDFRYRSELDYDAHYLEPEYPVDEVETLDIALSHWDGLKKIAHTMLSFGFRDGRHLVLSMETRLPKGAEQGFLPGLYKQYEVLNILGTEDDLFRLRTDFRGEELYCYRTNATPEQVRKAFRLVLRACRELEREPVFYNSLSANCTTTLAPLLKVFDPGFAGDIRLLLNGYSDRMLYEMGYLSCRKGESFEALKARRRVNQYLPGDPRKNYSERIRINL